MKIGEMHKFCENGEGDINFVEIEGKYAIASLALGMDSHVCNSNKLLGDHNQQLWDVMAHWLRRLLLTGGSWVRLPLWPSRRDLGQVLYLQLPVRFGVKLRYSIRAVVGSASEW